MMTAIDANHTVVSQDGATIAYLTMGSGPSVILIPGALSLASDYTTFGQALAERFTVHIIERRGRGKSSPQDAGYSIRKECEDVLALQRKIGASLLVGHSFGGLVALEVASNNRLFTKIAVYEPGVSIDGSIPAGWIPRFQQKLAEGKDVDAFVEFARGMSPESAGKAPPWLMKLLLPLFMSSDERNLKLGLLHECLREHQETIQLDNTYENYRSITAEVLLMYGGKSNTTWVHLAMERLAAVIPRSQTLEFPKFDHFGIDQKGPQEVAGAVSVYFLNGPDQHS